MPNQYEAIIEAFRTMEGSRTTYEISGWVTRKYGSRWKDFGTAMADMVPLSLGGNATSMVPERLRVLQRVSRGVYRLTNEKHGEELSDWDSVDLADPVELFSVMDPQDDFHPSAVGFPEPLYPEVAFILVGEFFIGSVPDDLLDVSLVQESAVLLQGSS